MLSQAIAAYWKQSKDVVYYESYTPSLLYLALPPLIQRRLPKIPSLRQTASTYGKAATAHKRVVSDSDIESNVTPPPSYHSSARNSTIETDDDEDAEAFHSLPPSRPVSSGSATPVDAQEGDSGVQWKYARQGFSLLAMSTQEESLLAQDPRFSRKLYLDSLGYLLRGLPDNLTAEEDLSLRAAFPGSPAGPVPGSELVVQSVVEEEHMARRPHRREASVLHQAVASMTLYTFLALSFILPYLQLLLQQAYQYDREHKISDRLFAQGLRVADALGKQTLMLASDIGAMNDGQIGIAVRDVGLWWVHGVSGGLYEGIGKGMQALGLSREVKTSYREEARVEE